MKVNIKDKAKDKDQLKINYGLPVASFLLNL